MRTRAWAMKTLNTQLASWTQLRHDTILYAKPSYTGMLICMYPAGFVEPRIEFWQHMQNMAVRTMNLINQLDYDGVAQYQTRSAYGSVTFKTAELWEIQSFQTQFLEQFSQTMATL